MKISGSKLIELYNLNDKVIMYQDTDTLRYVLEQDGNVLLETLDLQAALKTYKALERATGVNNV